jgi:hypothetical protein
MTAMITLSIMIVVTLLIPARFDPAIRLREWLNRREVK